MNPQDLMARIGAGRPPVDTGLASGLLKPVIEDGQPSVHLTKEMMQDAVVGESLAKMGDFLPAMGLAVIPAPDGGAFVFDPRKADPKDLAAGKLVTSKAEAPQAPTPVAAPVAAVGQGDLNAAAGQRKVNQERAQNM